MAILNSTSKLRSALLAAVMTGLIWIFAEGESVSTRTIIVPVSFPSEPAGDVLLRLNDSDFHGSARVRLEGTTRSLDAAALAVENHFRVVAGLPGVPSTPGEKRSVNMREALSGIPELRGLGSTVVDVVPATVNISVVRLVACKIPVHVDLEGLGVLESGPSCVPDTVTFRVPEQMADRLPPPVGKSADKLFAVARISEADLRKLHAGEVQSVPAIIHPPREFDGVQQLMITPEQAVVTLKLKRTADTMHIPTVPVWFSMPPTEDNGKWTIELQDKFITDVTLSGPTEQLQRIRSGAVAVKAMIELNSDDLAKGIHGKPAIFPDLPPGVTATAESQFVRLLKIAKRDGK